MRSCLAILFCFMFFVSGAQQTDVPSSIYSFKVKALDGSIIDFSQFKGKKLLLVNTPEEADYSRQYSELEALYQKYKDKLVIIGFLANDFQIEPGSRKTPNLQKHYNVTFPLAAKVIVRGNEMAPIYKWLTEKKYNHYKDTEIGWDFHKFLIDANGSLVAIFKPRTRPDNAELIKAIEQ